MIRKPFAPLVTALLFAAVAAPLSALEKLPIAEVSSATLTTETQLQMDSGDDHMSVLWWIPQEFWMSVFARDTATPEEGKKIMLDTLKNYSLIGVVQADIDADGGFAFYDKNQVNQGFTVSFQKDSGEQLKLTPLAQVDPNVQEMLDAMTPILTASMGNLGSNFHFYVYPNQSGSTTVVDAYGEGQLSFQLKDLRGQKMDASLALPLDALYKSRLCPNGKKAHVSWKFCPWTGKALSE
jgi:hypothetical protein